jgi:hypothetical protein
MLILRIRFCVRLLLIVALLGSGYGTPALQHAHAGGETAHDHDACHEHHDHHSVADHCHVDCGAESITASAVPHLHSIWFGMPVSIPVQNGSNPSGDSPATSCVDSHASDSIVVAAVSVPELVPLPAHCTDSARVPELRELSRSTSIGPVASSPLCDSARHERSGVQLT